MAMLQCLALAFLRRVAAKVAVVRSAKRRVLVVLAAAVRLSYISGRGSACSAVLWRSGLVGVTHAACARLRRCSHAN